MLNIAKALRPSSLITKVVVSSSKQQRDVSSTAVRSIDQKWREDRGLTANPNAFGPLTNLPDYTFLDGRPTPLGSNQTKRLKKQKEIVAKVVQLNNELKYAKERFARNQQKDAEKRIEIIQNKLKPKGHLLLKKSD